MKKTIINLSSLLLLVACNNNQPASEKPVKSPIDSLMDLVMHGHDEGMGRIGRLEKASQELTHKIDSIKQASKVNQQLLASWQKAQKDLALADSSMNRWMDSFDIDMEGMDSIAKTKYLQLNEKWVSGIADSVKTALDKADSLLQ
ncbi:MAG: hypothetical protein QM610_02565 [Chitinophagaceae bacterium]